MAIYGVPLDQLCAARARLDPPADLDQFWAEALSDDAAKRFEPSYTAVPTSLRLVESFDVVFAGYGGDSVRGWLHLPAERAAPLPCVV
jgi:cephalosporin-C deacetylase